MKLHTIPLAGRRVLRVGLFEHDHGDGEAPERRVILSTGWASDDPLLGRSISLPLERLADVLEALEGLRD